MNSDVSIIRRIFKAILDVFFISILPGIWFFQFVIYDEPNDFIYDQFLAAKIVVTLIIVFLVHNILFTWAFQRSITHWFCGYRLENSKGGRPELVQVAIREISSIFINGWFWLVTHFGFILFRKDRRSAHDLISGVTTKLHNDKVKNARIFVGLMFLLTVFPVLQYAVLTTENLFVRPGYLTMKTDGHIVVDSSGIKSVCDTISTQPICIYNTDDKTSASGLILDDLEIESGPIAARILVGYGESLIKENELEGIGKVNFVPSVFNPLGNLKILSKRMYIVATMGTRLNANYLFDIDGNLIALSSKSDRKCNLHYLNKGGVFTKDSRFSSCLLIDQVFFPNSTVKN